MTRKTLRTFSRNHHPPKVCKPVYTAGIGLPNGVILEVVRHSSGDGRLSFLVWNGKKAALRHTYECGAVYAPVVFPAGFATVPLPERIAPFRSVEQLVTELTRAFRTHAGTSESSAILLAAFVLTTWVADRFESPPQLSIVGPGWPQALQILRLLSCFCRHAVLLADIDVPTLASLATLQPTLLIDGRNLTPRAERILAASRHRGFRRLLKGQFAEFCWPMAVYADDLPDRPIPAQSIIVPAELGEQMKANLLFDTGQRLAAEFQPKLLSYRLHNLQKVRTSTYATPGFTYEVGDVAQSMALCLVGEKNLQAKIVDLLKPQDDLLKVERASELSSIVLEALLFFCHEKKTSEVFVHDICDAANAILKGRGEEARLASRKVGAIMKMLGLLTTRLGKAGRGISLYEGSCIRIHNLAWAHGVATVGNPDNKCKKCVELRAAQETQ